MPLLPGDLLLTGSPAGNGIVHGRMLRDGDVMVGAIEGLGAQTVRAVADPSTGSGTPSTGSGTGS
jgi:2-keto-4-pentenoate hydratase/2-oxohepta-3-ene-1,7-dioic acid hydratase in catechol pathway